MNRIKEFFKGDTPFKNHKGMKRRTTTKKANLYAKYNSWLKLLTKCSARNYLWLKHYSELTQSSSIGRSFLLPLAFLVAPFSTSYLEEIPIEERIAERIYASAKEKMGAYVRYRSPDWIFTSPATSGIFILSLRIRCALPTAAITAE